MKPSLTESAAACAALAVKLSMAAVTRPHAERRASVLFIRVSIGFYGRRGVAVYRCALLCIAVHCCALLCIAVYCCVLLRILGILEGGSCEQSARIENIRLGRMKSRLTARRLRRYSMSSSSGAALS